MRPLSPTESLNLKDKIQRILYKPRLNFGQQTEVHGLDKDFILEVFSKSPERENFQKGTPTKVMVYCDPRMGNRWFRVSWPGGPPTSFSYLVAIGLKKRSSGYGRQVDFAQRTLGFSKSDLPLTPPVPSIRV